MAKLYGKNAEVDFASANLMSFGKSFSRLSGQPLDKSEIWYDNFQALTDYALTDAAYVGQKVVYVDSENGTVTHYGIELNGELKELGTTPVGDNKSVVVAEDGTISLNGVPGLDFVKRNEDGTAVTDDEGNEVKVNYQPLMTEAGLTWIVPSATTVEGLAAEIEGLKSRATAVETAIGNAASEGVEATGLIKDIADNAAAIEAIDEKIGDVTEGKTVVEMIADAQEAATYDDEELVGRMDDAEDAIDALEEKAHEHDNKEELDKITEGDKAKWDAMEQNAKDYADGLDAEMAKRVKAIEDDYLKASDKTELEGAIEDAEENAVNRVLGYLAEEEINTSYDTLKEVAAWIESDTTASAQLVTRVSDIEKDYLKGADKTELEGAIEALGDYIGDMPEDAASETVIAYIQEVVDGLKIGDYAKASELTALADRVKALEDKAHEHENKDVIDGISAELVASWNAAEQNAKDYADELDGAMTERVDAIAEDVAGKVDAEEGKSLISDTLITKLEGIAEGAQVNAIDTVDETEFTLDGKKLAVKAVAMDKVTGLGDALAGKVATEDGKSLIADTLIEKLEGIADGAQVNAIDSVDTNQFALDSDKKLTLLDIAIGKVSGLRAELDSKVDKIEGSRLLTSDEATKLEKLVLGENGEVSVSGKVAAGNVDGLDAWITARAATLKGLSENNLTGTLLEKLNGIADGAQVNVIESVKVGDTVLDIVDKTVTIAIGAGLKASDEITIAADGALGVGAINVNKLEQTAGEVLILNGGAASM